MNAGTVPAYRPDIDGLRALSVIAVILFHGAVRGVTGGFVGVDIFFVISGFLITQLLVSRAPLPLGRWFAEFYVRRARRILPALLAMLLVVSAAAWWVFGPREFVTFGQSLFLSVAMLGNRAAYVLGGYFDTPWDFTPLQHLWSIAVEEQFYVAYPLALFLVMRYLPRRAWLPLGALATLASLGFCVWASAEHPHWNYYSPVSRAWQLGIGAVLALRADAWNLPRAARETLAGAALLAVGASMFAFDSLTPWPGAWSVVPCLAACGLIVSGEGGGSAVNRLLAARPLVFVGLLSYPLYLWHLPVQTFRNYLMVTPPGPMDFAVQLAVLALLAFASWKFIESPLRQRRWLPSNPQFLGLMGVIAVVLFVFGVACYRSDGFPMRLEPGERRLVTATHMPDAAIIACLPLPASRIEAGDLCHFGAPRRPDNVVVLWGDSHALAILPAIREIAEQRGLALEFAGQSSCRPTIGALEGFASAHAEQQCETFNEQMGVAVQKIHPRLVILAAYWALARTTASVDAGPSRPSAGEATFARGLTETVRRIATPGRDVCVVRDVPQFKYWVPHALAMARRRGVSVGFNALSLAAAREQQQAFDVEFDRLEGMGLFRTVSPRNSLCASGECRMLDDDGLPLFSDNNHLTPAGARYVLPDLAGCFPDQPMLPRMPYRPASQPRTLPGSR
jgi:peptidoglycan/LPS O-acetylase OafA/YrhL